MRNKILTVLVGAGFLLLYSASLRMLDAQRQARVVDDRLHVALPGPVQLLLAGGDRFLAANINVFRSMMVGTRNVDQTTVAVQAQLQSDAAVFNPGHEDNYYIAAATLAWQGELPSAQMILQRATEARKFDVYPPFFLGFNKQYFEGDFIGAAHAVEVAAERVGEPNRSALLAMAARWHEKGKDTDLALNTLRAMANQAKDPGLKRYILGRASRLEGLLVLRNAVLRFKEVKKRPPESLNELVDAGVLPVLPADPTGLGYVLDANGTPVLASGARPKSDSK